MEFLSGIICGGILTIGSAFVWKFYHKSERKDQLLAEIQGKDFEEKITLKEKR